MLQSINSQAEPDFVHGEFVERPAANYLHSRIQIRLSDAFQPWEGKRELFRASEIRLRLAPQLFRVADFAVFTAEQCELIPADVPYAVVEIVSPDDRFEDLMSKLDDYERAGVGFLFVADPPVRKLLRFRNGGLNAVAAIEIQPFGVEIPAQSIFG